MLSVVVGAVVVASLINWPYTIYALKKVSFVSHRWSTKAMTMINFQLSQTQPYWERFSKFPYHDILCGMKEMIFLQLLGTNRRRRDVTLFLYSYRHSKSTLANGTETHGLEMVFA